MRNVSVMLCAYNSEPFIQEAIDSVLGQTYQDFEFVIVDDGSTDNTLSIIRSYKDSRIKVLSCRHDYIHSLNVGLRNCHGEFIARMDADDRLMPKRLEVQLKFMQKHPDIVACFSWGKTFGEVEESIGHCAREKINNAYFWLMTGNFLMHPTAMLRKSFLREHHIRYKRYPYAEDYKLWTDIARMGGEFYVIPQPLFLYRIGSSQVSYQHKKEQNDTRLIIQQEVIEELIRRLNHPVKKGITKLYHNLLELNEVGFVQGDEIVTTMYWLFRRTHFFV